MSHSVQRRPPPANERELLIRAHALRGRALGEIAAALGMDLDDAAVRTKGKAGQLIEAALGADPQAYDAPDFSGLGIELKTIPINPKGSPAESTFVCGISMAEADQAQWETSRLRKKLSAVLWVPVQWAKSGPLPQRLVGEPVLWRPNDYQWQLLQADWEHLMGSIGAGHSDTLTARDGEVLQVRPKAAHSQARRFAPGDDGPVRTLPLGFYLRTAFTAHVLLEASTRRAA